MYVCGPTVYNHIHIGNARSAIVFDVIRRYLAWRGYEVTFVQNYTDIDDRIIVRAAQQKRPADEVAADYSRAFEAVMTALDVAPPDILVKATEHISEMIEMIETLIEKGFAYAAGGSVWFSVEGFEGYGKLSGRTLDDVRAGERVEPDVNKRQPLDFSVWKAAKEGEPSWESPWGPGRPGWHIECSAMSAKYLGMGFDIHGGGTDLIFPHHENEIAQSEAAFGTAPFAKYWLHNGMINMDAIKMSKSLGNFVLAKELLETVRPQVLRLMAVSGHYRTDLDFGENSLDQAARTIERFDTFAAETKDFDGPVSPEGQKYLDEFTEAMDDDFNTPAALGVVHDLLKRANTVVTGGLGGVAAPGRYDLGAPEAANPPKSTEVAGLVAAFRQMTDVLGISVAFDSKDGLPDDLMQLVEAREAARKDGRFDESDRIRDELGRLGVSLKDGPEGTTWRLKN